MQHEENRTYQQTNLLFFSIENEANTGSDLSFPIAVKFPPYDMSLYLSNMKPIRLSLQSTVSMMVYRLLVILHLSVEN